MKTENAAAHIPALDGVRGLAILLVLCYDCLKLPAGGSVLGWTMRKISASGWIGVDLFFVLSGFLITGILLDTVGRTGYWRSFLGRRALRIFPLYFGFLLLVFLLAPFIAQATRWTVLSAALQQVGQDQVWYWLYAQNWLFAWQGAWPEERVLNHFWSLAVEEQFYLIWPAVVAVCTRRQLGWTCGICCGIALGLRCLCWAWEWPAVVSYVSTITRMDSLCAGALLALGCRTPAWQARWLPLFPRLLPMVLLPLLVINELYPLLKSESFGAGTIGHTLIALVFVLLIGALLQGESVLSGQPVPLLNRLFCWRGLRILGKYSYGIYVFHRAIYYGLLQGDWSFLPESLRGWAIFAATLLGTLLVARLSWELWESRFLAWKRFVPRPDETPLSQIAHKERTDPQRVAGVEPAIAEQSETDESRTEAVLTG